MFMVRVSFSSLAVPSGVEVMLKEMLLLEVMLA